MNTQFKKGQVVFQACSNFAVVGVGAKNGNKYTPEVRIGIVLERELDACGKQQVSFVNRGGNNFVFGRTYRFSWGSSDGIFATAAKAFSALQSDVVCPDVYSDENKQSFDDLRSGKMRIAEVAKK